MRMDRELEMMAAVLHDVVEDTKTTSKDLSDAGYPREVVDAVHALTKRPGEAYDEAITRVLTNEIATKVKLADLEDNMNILRISEPTQRDLERLGKYRRAWQTLREAQDESR